MVFARCGLFLKGMRWITKLLYMFCSMLFQVKFGRKTYFCKLKECIVKIRSEELQKPFKYFAIFYSVEKKYAAAQIVQSIIFELL